MPMCATSVGHLGGLRSLKESDGHAVNTCDNPPMLYDYYGFPKYTYELDYPAPGNPELAKKVCGVLRVSPFSPSAVRNS